MAVIEEEVVTYPGARAPDRRRTVNAHGIELAVYEWGDPAAPPLLLVHGYTDFARTFDVFAPRLAAAGYRVISYDHRGHGDSQHTELYSWYADTRDLLAVADTVSREPLPVIGHSRGGAMLIYLVDALPHRFTRVVSIDGVPVRRRPPERNDDEAAARTRHELTRWLDSRQAVASFRRKPDTLDGLAKRRALHNPRLSHEWLRYLVSVGARRDPDGWRWKIDPSLHMLSFGPWRARWTPDRLRGFATPMLALLGTESEAMSWGVTAADVAELLPKHSRAIEVPNVGHFIHIERSAETAELVLEFLRG